MFSHFVRSCWLKIVLGPELYIYVWRKRDINEIDRYETVLIRNALTKGKWFDLTQILWVKETVAFESIRQVCRRDHNEREVVESKSESSMSSFYLLYLRSGFDFSSPSSSSFTTWKIRIPASKCIVLGFRPFFAWYEPPVDNLHEVEMTTYSASPQYFIFDVPLRLRWDHILSLILHKDIKRWANLREVFQWLH